MSEFNWLETDLAWSPKYLMEIGFIRNEDDWNEFVEVMCYNASQFFEEVSAQVEEEV